ncbi:MAG: amino acid ABC transporter ATP-binding protein, partial [Actinobacteria bacterium]|nr:amino acid ABC transporter ATP-binding protein [Actinomycetota bacterium]
LDVSAGEVVSLIGASGSGKTTVLRCINLLEQVDDGAVLLDGDEVSAVGRDPNPVRRRVGIVFQSFNLFPHMSVVRNITLALTEVLGQSGDTARDRASELLARFGLAEKASCTAARSPKLAHPPSCSAPRVTNAPSNSYAACGCSTTPQGRTARYGASRSRLNSAGPIRR